ncbi:30S ribosomal protein S4 [bacterium]|nr:30S ribosomal protein S4 [bacterium]
MARKQESVCRLCRVERTKLFLKGSKCLSDKCPVERRSYPPGEHGRRRRRILGYGIQIREKQKLKRYYSMTEKQFRLFFKRAEKRKGVTGEILLSQLERRLDNVLFLAGFSRSRGDAVQLINHGHVVKNGRKASVPSMLVDKDDVISFKESAKNKSGVQDAMELNENKAVPGWLDVDRENMKITVVSYPARKDIPIPVEEHLVVELYSR